MREWYEEIWRELPDELDPPYFEERRRHLLRHVGPGSRALELGSQVLDLGCGDGAFVPVLLEAGAVVTGADIAEGALERARRRAPEARYVRIEPHGRWPFEDGEFDVVWASEVMEHVADTERWVNEVRRVLAPGGAFVVTTPNATDMDGPPDPRGQHLRFYSVASLGELLQDMDFRDLNVMARDPLLLATAIRR